MKKGERKKERKIAMNKRKIKESILFILNLLLGRVLKKCLLRGLALKRPYVILKFDSW